MMLKLKTMLLAIYMDQSAKKVFAPALKQYASVLLEKIMPVFDDLDGEQQRAGDEFLDSLSPHTDYDSAMDAAYDHSIDHVLLFQEMRSTFLAAGVAGLFHLFERQIYRHLKRETRDYQLTDTKDQPFIIDEISKVEELLRCFTKGHNVLGQTIKEAWEDPDLVEARLVANAVKHGTGKSYDKLRQIKARVIDPVRVEADFTVGDFTSNSPLVIEPEDVIRYRDAMLRFWQVRGSFEWDTSTSA